MVGRRVGHPRLDGSSAQRGGQLLAGAAAGRGGDGGQGAGNSVVQSARGGPLVRLVAVGPADAVAAVGIGQIVRPVLGQDADVDGALAQPVPLHQTHRHGGTGNNGIGGNKLVEVIPADQRTEAVRSVHADSHGAADDLVASVGHVGIGDTVEAVVVGAVLRADGNLALEGVAVGIVLLEGLEVVEGAGVCWWEGRGGKGG